jgi:hypothetical protein
MDFDEGSGDTVADASLHANNGTRTGATWTASGLSGNALDFDGVDDKVSLGDRTSLDCTGAVTVEAWIYHRGGDYRGIVYNGSSWADRGYCIWYFESNIRVELQTNGEKTTVDNPAPSSNAWHHVAFTWDIFSKTIRTYIDGT